MAVLYISATWIAARMMQALGLYVATISATEKELQ
jgi:hypothetical protein